MKTRKKARQAEPTVEPEKALPVEEQPPAESPPEDAIVRGGTRGAAVGGLLGGAGGAAIGGIFGLIDGALGDRKKKNRFWG